MSKICAKCTKSVYPLEELKCLDKIWHKTCFRCLECGMLLNMKNYKGYNKNPYCSAHYPQTKATVVADTPELHRLTQNTKIQSQVKYHEDFEKNIKGSKIQVSDDPETERIRQVNHLVSQVEYKGGTKEKIGNLEARRQSLPPKLVAKPARVLPNNTNRLADTTEDKFSPFSARTTAHSITYNAGREKVPAPHVKRVGSIADYDPVNENYGSLGAGYKPASRQTSQSQEWEETVPLSPTSAAAQPHIVKEVDQDANNEVVTPSSETAKSSGFDNHNGSSKSGDVDIDEHNEKVPIGRREVIEPEEEVEEIVPSPPEPNNTEVEENEARKIEYEAVETVEPIQHSNQNEKVDDDVTEEVVNEPHEGVNVEDDNMPEERELEEREPEDVVPEEDNSTAEENAGGIEENPVGVDEEEKIKTEPMPGIFVALYDYDAQDEDEVGFVEGDQIVDCKMIDEGWMYGRVVRTGGKGMLPSNYVEQSGLKL